MMTFPTPNMNGTSRQELMQLQLDCVRAIDRLKDAMGRAAPHGRDYFGGYDDARREHLKRLASLQELRDQYIAIATHVYDSKSGW